MHVTQTSNIRLIIILGLLSMLTPLAIDMYLPSLPVIAKQFQVGEGQVQLTLSSYVLGFAVGQMFYGPMSDSLGRKPIIVGGTLVFSLAGAACALSQSVEQLMYMRFLHGLSAAAASVVINALMRDMFNREEFSRMMSFVTLVMTAAPLVAPMLGGWLTVKFSWHVIFWVIAAVSLIATLLVIICIKETLPKELRQPFHFYTTLRNFSTLFRNKQVLAYMVLSACSFSGMFAFFSAGPFIYIDLYGIKPQHFGYYFALNVVFLFVMTVINSRYVKRYGALNMLKLGVNIQFSMGLFLLLSGFLDLGFWALVFGIAVYMGCIATVTSNAMAVVLEHFPHMAGTVSSLAGTIRFGIGAAVGGILATLSNSSAWPMIIAMFVCVTVMMILFIYTRRLTS